MISKIVKLLKALNANVNPAEIAHAFSLGLLLGFLPKDNLLWYLIFVFVLFIRINKPMYLIMVLIGSALSPALDSLFDVTGCFILTLDGLQGLFRTLVEIPFVAFTKFNNSVVMGALVCGIVLYIPVYFLGRLFVASWRKYLTPIMRHSKIAKIFTKLPLVSKIVSMAGDN